jgi:hyperosmotically inducible protein
MLSKLKYASLALLISIPMFGAITGCASTHRQESTGQYFDSSAVTLKVKSALLADDQIKSLPITVNTYKNSVQLSGFVDTAAQKARALSVAQHVEGVKMVKDSLIIKHH